MAREQSGAGSTKALPIGGAFPLSCGMSSASGRQLYVERQTFYNSPEPYAGQLRHRSVLWDGSAA